MRVADVKTFVTWLLEGVAGPNGVWTEADIDTAIASAKRQDVRLAKPVPVAWVYLTGYATADGAVHFRDDIYGLDAPSEPAPTPPTAEPTDIPVTSSITPRRMN